MGDGFFLQVAPHWQLSKGNTKIEVGSHKARALLSFLVFEGNTLHSREKLATLFWPNSNASKARASLRQIALQLGRKTNGADLLRVSRHGIGLGQAQIATSVQALQTQIKAGQFSQTLEQHVKSLDTMLSEFEDISEAFTAWVHTIRTREVASTAKSLRAIYQAPTNPAQLRNECAMIARQLDPYDEDAVRAGMQSFAEMNNTVAALRLYGKFFAFLEHEIDAEPSIETQDLAVALKLEDTASPRPAAAAQTPCTTRDGTITVAVLPFEALGHDIPDFVILGLLDHITCKLATYRAPAVISSNTTRRFFKKCVDPQEIGRQLGTNYAVSGSIRSHNNQAAVSIQLTNTANSQIIWANTHQCSVSDLFDVNIPIASEIAQVLSPSMNAAELARTMRAPVEDLEPYHLMLRAKDLIFQLSQKTFGQAGALLQRAILANPQFGPAHSLLAEWYAIALWQGWTKDAARDAKAMESHLQKAVSLSPGDGRALGLWGHGQLMFHQRHDAAMNAVSQAIALCPSDAETLIWSVPTFAMSGDPQRGIEVGEKALRLSPLDPFVFRNEHFLGIAHYAAGNFERAAELGLSSYRRAPNYASNLRATIAALVATDRVNEAKEMVAQHHYVEPDFRVENLFARQTFKSETQRRAYCDQLLVAGMP